MSPDGGRANGRSGPGDEADRLIFRDRDPPGPDRQALQAAKERRRLTTRDPVRLEQRQLLALVLVLTPDWCAAFLEALPGSRAIGRLSKGPAEVRWAHTDSALDPTCLGYRHFGNS